MPDHRKPCDLPTAKSTDSFWHKEPSALLKAHRTTRDLPKHADVVIVGSGITGTSIAHHLFHTDRSHGDHDYKPRVVMLEAREACWGATGRNGGHCQPLLYEHPHDPAIGRFELKNYATLQALIKEKNVDCEFVAQPGVRALYGTRSVAKAASALSAVDRTASDLSHYMRLVTSKDELAHLRVPTADAAVVTNVAARLWPYKLVAHLLEELLLDANLHGTFNLQTLTPVDSLSQRNGRWLVRTSRGTIEAENVVLATNGHTSHLLPAFSDLVVPCRGQMSALEPHASLVGANRLKTSVGFDGDGLDDYLIQRPSSDGEHLMFGGGRHLAPGIGISDDSTIDPQVAAYLRQALPKRMQSPIPENTHPVPELKATNEWTGIMAWSRDGLPWVGPVPAMDGLYLSAGYTGHGMPNAWLCGKALVAMMHEAAYGTSQAEAVARAQIETGLPSSYVLSQGRVEAASKLDPLEVQEEQEKHWS